MRIFRDLLASSNQLRVLSLRYCQFAGDEVMLMIAEHVNPFSLKELYLDGCEAINDDALFKLTKQRELSRLPALASDFRDSNNSNITELR